LIILKIYPFLLNQKKKKNRYRKVLKNRDARNYGSKELDEIFCQAKQAVIFLLSKIEIHQIKLNFNLFFFKKK